MKKFTMAMLIALLGAGFVACGDDKDDDEEKKSCESACEEVANATSTQADDCTCSYVCKEGYEAADASVTDKAIVCNAKAGGSCESACKDVANAKATQAEDCSCSYACNEGYEAADATVKDETIVCNAKAGACEKACDAVDNAKATQAEDCSCSYACNEGYEAADASVTDKTIVCNFVKLANGEHCNNDSECVSGFCDTDEEGDGVCGTKSSGDTTDYKPCEADGECDAAKGEYCVAKQCRTAASFIMQECEASSANFCVGDKTLVSCVESDMGYLYDTSSCPSNTSCKLDDKNAYACVPDSVDAGACSAENEGEKKYTACGGVYDGDIMGYTEVNYKKCTKNGDGTYSWVEGQDSCSNSQACLESCPSKGCTNDVNC